MTENTRHIAQALVGQPLQEVARYSAADLRTGTPHSERSGGVTVRTVHVPGDAPDVRRLMVEWPDGRLELQPTKGLSIGPYRHGDWEPFWTPVVPALISPESEQLLGDVLVHGNPVAALRWVENFSGCVELLGLSNWGMPAIDEATGTPLSLHGEAARIPVDGAAVGLAGSVVVVTGSFTMNSRWWSEPDDGSVWYLRGTPDWRIERTVLIDTETPRLRFVDTIENIGTETAIPDWGYHVQLRAEPGAELIIPARSSEERSGGATPPTDFRRWRPDSDPAVREERGYVHKGVPRTAGPFDTDIVTGAAVYPQGPATIFTMPASAYTLSWFSCGGKDSLEFALPESPQSSLLPVAWDGIGPEIGVSALDHDGNTDPDMVHPPLEPGRSTRLSFSLASVSADDARREVQS